MEPTTALPVHLTCEIVVVAAAGLLVAWSALRRRWTATASAISLLVVECLHAGQFIEREDDPFLVAFRFIGIAGLAASVFSMALDRLLFGTGLAALASGALWGTIAGGTATELAVGPHVIAVIGALVLLAWVWRATRPSVRLRVLAAFVAVLAVTVVVAGGAVARVAAVNSRDEQFTRLSGDATTIRRHVIATRDELRRRVAILSPFLSSAITSREVTLDPTRFLPGEWTVVLDHTGAPIGDAETEGTSIPYNSTELRNLTIADRALSGKVASAVEGSSDGLIVVASAPVFRPGGTATTNDVIGGALLGRLLSPRELDAFTSDPRSEVVTEDGNVTAATERDLSIVPQASPSDAIALRTLDAGDDKWLAAIAPVPDGSARIIVASPIALVVADANDLVRAFLLAILAAALLAVIAALWLSARISRPMLDLAEDAERVKADFLASVSHELRTPLTPIRGYTEILRRGRIPARDASGYLDEIGQAAQRLERIVALLLDVAAIEAGRFRIDAHDVDAGDLLGDAEKRWRGRSRRHMVHVSTPGTLPKVTADPEAIARVLDELIDNAVKFSPGGRIELSARASDGGVEFTVRDEGPGIDSTVADTLREAFRQADTGDTRRFGGLGLGLAFSEGVLAEHGATLEIRSVPDEGTICSFTLPAGSVTPMSPTRDAAPRARSSRAGTPRDSTPPRTASRKR